MLFFRHQNWLIRGHFDCDYRRFFINCSWHFRHASAHSRSSFTLTDLHVDAKSRDLTHSSTHVTPVTSAYTSVVYTRAQSIRVRVRLTRITRIILYVQKQREDARGRRTSFPFRSAAPLRFSPSFFPYALILGFF